MVELLFNQAEFLIRPASGFQFSTGYRPNLLPPFSLFYLSKLFPQPLSSFVSCRGPAVWGFHCSPPVIGRLFCVFGLPFLSLLIFPCLCFSVSFFIAPVILSSWILFSYRVACPCCSAEAVAIFILVIWFDFRCRIFLARVQLFVLGLLLTVLPVLPFLSRSLLLWNLFSLFGSNYPSTSICTQFIYSRLYLCLASICDLCNYSFFRIKMILNHLYGRGELLFQNLLLKIAFFWIPAHSMLWQIWVIARAMPGLYSASDRCGDKRGHVSCHVGSLRALRQGSFTSSPELLT